MDLSEVNENFVIKLDDEEEQVGGIIHIQPSPDMEAQGVVDLITLFDKPEDPESPCVMLAIFDDGHIQIVLATEEKVLDEICICTGYSARTGKLGTCGWEREEE